MPRKREAFLVNETQNLYLKGQKVKFEKISKK